jgi:hypothetical protein
MIGTRINSEEIGDYIERLGELREAQRWQRQWFVAHAVFSVCMNTARMALREVLTSKRGA